MGTVIFIVIGYIMVALVVKSTVKSDIGHYLYYSWGELPSQTAHNFVSSNRDRIINVFASIFPIYFGYKYGCQFGIQLYKTLIDREYENRIIAWLF
jgi:hypothetical protein